VDHYNICRVIARPFVGTNAENFTRTGNRHDYAVPPPAATILQKLKDAGGQVVSIGKIADIFADCGITHKIKATGNAKLWDATLTALRETPDFSIIMTNFVDFDQDFGHRRNVAGYAAALEAFDRRLPEFSAALGPEDLTIISADHGCDPTWPGSDHTREYVPVLAWGNEVTPRNLGIRGSFADVGQSLAQYFRLPGFPDGVAFL
jgi:phosphopentomutase